MRQKERELEKVKKKGRRQKERKIRVPTSQEKAVCVFVCVTR